MKKFRFAGSPWSNTTFLLLFAGLCSATDTIPPISIAGAPAIVIQHKDLEINFFNVFSTQKIDTEFDTTTYRSRFSNLTHILQLNYGLSKNNRWNAGLELYYSHARSGEGSESIWKLFGDNGAGGDNQRALSGLGFRLRGHPWRRLPELTLQSSVVFPLNPGLQMLDFSRTQWQVGANYYHRFNYWLHGFMQIDVMARFSNKWRAQTTYLLPVNLYLVGQVVEGRLYAFPSLSYNGNFEKRYKGSLRQLSYQLLAGLGAQYRFSDAVQATLQYQFPFANDLGSLNSESVSGSYQVLSLGVRFLVAP